MLTRGHWQTGRMACGFQLGIGRMSSKRSWRRISEVFNRCPGAAQVRSGSLRLILHESASWPQADLEGQNARLGRKSGRALIPAGTDARSHKLAQWHVPVSVRR